MEKITKTIPKHKNIQVEDGYQNVDMFISFDGKEFTSEKSCREYEKSKLHTEQLKKLKVKYFNFQNIDELTFPTIWYYVSNENELETVLTQFSYYNNYQKISINNISNKSGKLSMDNFPMNQWYGHIFEDGGDYDDSNRIYTFDFFRTELDEFLNGFSK